MLVYLLKSSACLFVLWVLYVSILESQNIHKFKRFYLIASLIISAAIPFLSITEYIDPIPQISFYETTTTASTPIITSEEFVTSNDSFDPLSLGLWSIYGIGVLVFFVRFIANLIRIKKRINDNEKHYESNFVYVLLHTLKIPHSFFKYIFLHSQAFKNSTVPEEVIIHEKAHAEQWHSLDILFIELLQVIFWFHPLVYLLKHHIKLNHEFLADQAVLSKGVSSKTYQHILLQFSSSSAPQHTMFSALNYSSFKKRFTVMLTQTSKTKRWLSFLLLLPISAVLFYSFSDRTYIEKPSEPALEITQSIQSTQASTNEAPDSKMKEYRDFINEYNETKIIYGDKYERAIIIYDDLMSDEQRASVQKYPERLIPSINLSKTTPRKLTSKLFEDFKNEKNYAIWIDGKHIQNSDLNNYSHTDFVHYSGSIVLKNARTKQFPQPNQYHLYTKNGFEHTYQNSQLRRYKKAAKLYTDAISIYLKGSKKDNSELEILYRKAYKIYASFSKEELKSNDIKMPPPLPAQYPDNKPFHTARNLNIKVLGNDNYNVNGILTNKASFVSTVNNFNQDISTKERNRIINIHLTFADKETDEEVWFVYNSLLDYGFHRLVTEKQEVIKSKGNTPFKINNDQSTNKNTGFRQVNGKLLWYTLIQGKTTYYNRNGVITDKNGMELIPGKQESAYNILPNQVVKRVYKDDKIVVEFKDDLNSSKAQKVKKINPVNVDVKKDKTLVLNGKSVERLSLIEEIKKINNHLSKEEIREYVNVSFVIPNKDYTAYVKTIQKELIQNGIYGSSIAYSSSLKKSKLPIKHIGLYNGLTVSEAKARRDSIYNGDFDKKHIDKNQKNSPWKVGDVKIESVEFIPDGDSKSKEIPVSEDVLYRRMILKLSTEQTEPIVYYLNGKKSAHSDIETYLEHNPTADVMFKTGTPNKLYFTNRQDKAMTKSDLQNLYSELFKFYKKPDGNKVYYKKVNTYKNGPNTVNQAEYASKLRNKYISKFKQYEALRYAKPHFLRKSKSDRKTMNTLWLELRQLYIYSLTKEEKEGLNLPTSPFAPYVRVNLNGKSYYKINSKLTDNEKQAIMIFGNNQNYKGLDLIDNNDPVVIPIEKYELEVLPKDTSKKREVYISISENGNYAISKDNTLKNFEPISLESLEKLLEKLSKKERENTVVFASSNDYKRFRSKPSSTPEYQDDIEVKLIKDDIKFPVVEFNGTYREMISTQAVLDNNPSNQLKSHAQKLALLFRKHHIKKMSL